MSELVSAADIAVGAAWVEKDAIYTNDQGRVQASACDRASRRPRKIGRS